MKLPTGYYCRRNLFDFNRFIDLNSLIMDELLTLFSVCKEIKWAWQDRTSIFVMLLSASIPSKCMTKSVDHLTF
jgi:preprotein translocase subunit Sec63